MTEREHEQTDLFGGSTPAWILDLPGHVRALAEAERQLDGQLTADEAGAIIHERRGKHHRDTRCSYCTEDGTEALERLRAKTQDGYNHAEASS